jgi:DNA-binding beta-propeller fold protein YncE
MAACVLAVGVGAACAEEVVVVAGGGERNLVAGEEIPALDVRLTEPFSVDFDDQGNLYGVEYQSGNRVFRITPEGTISLVAGIYSQTNRGMGDVAEGDGERGERARFNGMHDLAWHPEGSLYIADAFNNRIRRIDLESGIVSTFAGTGEAGFGGDGGLASEACFSGPHTVAFCQGYERLYIADLDNFRVRMIDMETGIVTTVAGNGENGRPEDGRISLEAPLVSPRAVTVDRDENIWIASRNGHALRVVSAVDGTIRTVVGLAGERGYGGDGGLGGEALLAGPKHLCLDPSGRIVISDDENHAIRVYDPRSGKIDLLAGTPQQSGASLNVGGARKTGLNRPHGARYARDGSLFIADSNNGRILRVRH